MSVAEAKRWFGGVVLALTCLGGLWGLDQASAEKPGGRTHTGRIYFHWFDGTPGGSIYQMYEDGSSKLQVLPSGVYGSPSSKVYGGSRWWLTTGIDTNSGFTELFAFRSEGSPPVQLTLAGPDGFVFDPQAQENNLPRWSSDARDTFVAVNAGTIVGPYLCRLWISGNDIAEIEAGTLQPITGADIELILPQPGPYPIIYSWSNQPDALAYFVPNFDGAGNPISTSIWVRFLPDIPTDPPIDRPIYTGHIPWNMNLGWSPDGSRIAFNTVNTSTWGGVWTIRPDGTGALQVKANTAPITYGFNGWSPDSREMLILSAKLKSGYEYQIARMPAGGGGLTVLTSDLPTNLKSAVAWFALTP